MALTNPNQKKVIETGKRLPLSRILTIMKNYQVTIVRWRHMIWLDFRQYGIAKDQLEMIESFVDIFFIDFKHKNIQGTVRGSYRSIANRLIKEERKKFMDISFLNRRVN